MHSFLKKFSYLILILLFLTQCGLYKKTDARKVPVNAKDRVQKNLEEGRRIKFGNLGNPRSGEFEFATSNEMWRAAIEVLDFVPLTTADYGGGIIITDWYSDNLDSEESIKIMVNFLSNEIRADGLKVKIYKKICNNNQKCNTQLMTSELDNEIKLAVLRKAAQIKNEDGKRKGEESDYRVTPTGE